MWRTYTQMVWHCSRPNVAEIVAILPSTRHTPPCSILSPRDAALPQRKIGALVGFPTNFCSPQKFSHWPDGILGSGQYWLQNHTFSSSSLLLSISVCSIQQPLSFVFFFQLRHPIIRHNGQAFVSFVPAEKKKFIAIFFSLFSTFWCCFYESLVFVLSWYLFGKISSNELDRNPIAILPAFGTKSRTRIKLRRRMAGLEEAS